MQHFQIVPSLLALPAEALRTICNMLIATKAPAVHPHRLKSDYDYVSLLTVFSLTRTSRALHEHAADALRETVPSFGILVYTLPPDIWSYETLVLGDGLASCGGERPPETEANSKE